MENPFVDEVLALREQVQNLTRSVMVTERRAQSAEARVDEASALASHLQQQLARETERADNLANDNRNLRSTIENQAQASSQAQAKLTKIAELIRAL